MSALAPFYRQQARRGPATSHQRRDCHAGPPEITVPGFAARSGFVGAAAYWLAVHVYRELSPTEGKALITTAFLAHGALSDLAGYPLDWTAPLAWLGHALARVPMPDALPDAARRAAASVDSRPAPSESKKEK